MATGGLALLLSPQVQPHSFRGLETIGKVVYIYDLMVFSLITAAISYRFIKHPGTLRKAMTHPTESLFFGAALLSSASIIGSIGYYGAKSCGPWLIVVYRVLFWIYFAAALSNFIGQYYMMFTNPELRSEDMTPAWDLPILPTMLTGTIAAIGAVLQPVNQAVPIIVGGLTAQGLGMLVSIFMFSNYTLRWIQYGLPSPQSRPGMFIAVGPPAFTAVALIELANAWPTTRDFAGSEAAAIQMMRILATFSAVFLWSLALWIFMISAISCIAVWRQITFHLNWWSFVFPNIGFVLSVIAIGKEFQSQGILWVGSIMTILLICVYLFVLAHHIRAVVTKQIVYPGKDEDVYIKQRMDKVDKRLQKQAALDSKIG
jgi:C4-dicarboxylate transporter/malic acid transport protein